MESRGSNLCQKERINKAGGYGGGVSRMCVSQKTAGRTTAWDKKILLQGQLSRATWPASRGRPMPSLRRILVTQDCYIVWKTSHRVLFLWPPEVCPGPDLVDCAYEDSQHQYGLSHTAPRQARYL